MVRDGLEEQEGGTTSPAQSGGAEHMAILRRMITAPDSAPTPAPAASDPSPAGIERGAALALGRAADRLYHLPVYVENVTVDVLSPAELAELFPERSLLAVVQGAGDRLGVVALCPDLVASLIEVQAIGRVSSRPVRPRRPTRTDAAISAEFVDALLSEIAQEVRGRTEAPGFSGFAYASYLDDARPLLLMLEDAPLSCLSIRFRVGTGGLRNAQLLIALPVPATRAAVGAPPGMDAAPTDQARPDDEKGDLRAVVAQAPVALTGVLCRRMMTLGQIRAMKEGDTLPLGADVMAHARLETTTGLLLTTGRLGEDEGRFAIRLQADQKPVRTGPDSIDTTAPDSFRPQDSLPNGPQSEADISHLSPDPDAPVPLQAVTRIG